MQAGIAMPATYLTLPFAVENKNVKTKLSDDMELAAIVCASETEHPISEAQNSAKATLISKLHYPIWAISREESCFLLDGLRLVTGDIPLLAPLDPEALIEDLKRNTKDQDQFLRTLRKERETFKGPPSRSRFSILGFIDDKQMLTDIMDFIKDIVASGKVFSGVQPDSLIPPRMSQEEAVRISNEISEHYDTLQSAIKGLQYANETVTQETQIHADKLQQELHEMQENFGQQIALLTEKVNGKIAQLQNERDFEIAKMTTKTDKSVRETFSEKRKLEKQLLGLEQDKKEYEKRKDLRRSRQDEPGEARWKVRLENVKKQIFEVKRKIKSVSDLLSNTQKEIERTTKNLRENCDRLIDLEKKKIEALEKSRNSETEKKSEKIKDLQHDTLILTHNIEDQIDQIKLALTEYEEAKIPWDVVETPTLICIPTYIVGQKIKNENRYFFFPPVIAEGHKRLTVTIGSALGFSSLGSRINSMLRPRSKYFEKIFNSLQKEMEKDETLEGTVSQIATTKNLTTLPEFLGRLRNGLEQLEDKGWIKPEERDAILSQNAS
jgi:uncharacterized coiled-coil protein SlyX